MKLSHQTPDLEPEGAEEAKTENKLGKSPSQQISLLVRAIRYLSIREHSQEELIRKLKPHASSIEEVEVVLQKLLDKGLQSNERFAENLIRRKAERYGQNRLLQELKQHQIDPHMRSELLEKVKDSEFERAHALWERKFGVVTKDPKEMAKQARFLANRGFSSELISKIIRSRNI
jgi:regulatory protein